MTHLMGISAELTQSVFKTVSFGNFMDPYPTGSVGGPSGVFRGVLKCLKPYNIANFMTMISVTVYQDASERCLEVRLFSKFSRVSRQPVSPAG